MKSNYFVRMNRGFSRLALQEIIYIESLKNYIQIVTAKNKFMIKATMSHIEKVLPREDFCRIHRSYIVSINAITEFNHGWVHVNGKHLPISEQYKKTLLSQIVLLDDPGAKKQPVQIDNNNGMIGKVK